MVAFGPRPAFITDQFFTSFYQLAEPVLNDEGTIRGTAARFHHRDVQSSCWLRQSLFVVASALLSHGRGWLCGEV